MVNNICGFVGLFGGVPGWLSHSRCVSTSGFSSDEEERDCLELLELVGFEGGGGWVTLVDAVGSGACCDKDDIKPSATLFVPHLPEDSSGCDAEEFHLGLRVKESFSPWGPFVSVNFGGGMRHGFVAYGNILCSLADWGNQVHIGVFHKPPYLDLIVCLYPEGQGSAPLVTGCVPARGDDTSNVSGWTKDYYSSVYGKISVFSHEDIFKPSIIVTFPRKWSVN